MGTRNGPVNWLPHFVLTLGVVIFAFPIYFALIGSTHDAATIATGRMPLVPGGQVLDNYWHALTSGTGFRVSGTPVRTLLLNSLIMALIIAIGKIAISIVSAYAVAFFSFPGRMFFFWMIFVTLMLPVEVRIIPTYKVVTDLHIFNTFTGLTVPLIASATATLLFRQVFLTIPDELAEAAKIDGAGALRFFWKIDSRRPGDARDVPRRDARGGGARPRARRCAAGGPGRPRARVRRHVPAEMKSSQLVDLAAGRRIEAPWLSGAVARMAAAAGVPAPVHATLFAALKPWVNGAP